MSSVRDGRRNMAWVSEGTGARSFTQAHHVHALTGPLDSDGPSFTATSPSGRQVNILTDYHGGVTFLNDPRFSRAAVVAQSPVGPATAVSVTALDPPRHTIARGLINRMFSLRNVMLLGPQVERHAVSLIEKMKRVGPPADLVSSFC